MAKVWKPKYWDAKNPPDAGSRVFVGKANGASSYESIAAGQTKRILQSDGRGNIFYGNVTVPDPLSPTLESNLPSGDYSSAQIGNPYSLTMSSVLKGGSYVSFNFACRIGNNSAWDFRKSTINGVVNDNSGGRYFAAGKPCSLNNFSTLANKLTLYENDNFWIIFNITDRFTRSDQDNKLSYEFTPTVKAGVYDGAAIDANSTTSISSFTSRWRSGAMPDNSVTIVLSNEPSWSN